MFVRRLRVNWRYAAGEIVIIVLGILIAITLDNWNDAWSERRLEQEYLARLADDLSDDTATFRFVDQALMRKNGALALADSILSGQLALRDTVTLLQALISGSNFAWHQPRIRSTTFDELQSTGHLRLIRNPELRAQIVQYYESAGGDLGRIRERRTPYGPMTYGLLPRKEEFVLDSAAVRARLKALTLTIQRSDIRSAITAERNFAAFIGSMNAEFLQRALALLKQVETELN